MDLVSLLSLALAMLILAASPGPGVFATIARSLASGFRPALWIIAGIITGDGIYLMFAVFGLSAVAQTFGELFVVVKICGSAYLIWLGLKIFFSKPPHENTEHIQGKSSKSGNFTSGLLLTLSNPKAMLFYCSFLPTCTDLSALSIDDIVILIAVVTIVLASVLTTYAYLASQARQLISNHTSIQRMNRSAGSLMIATGAAIAFKS